MGGGHLHQSGGYSQKQLFHWHTALPHPQHLGILEQGSSSRKPSHQSPPCSLSSQTMLSAVASDSQPSVPKDNSPVRSSRVMIPSPCCLSDWRLSLQHRPDCSWREASGCHPPQHMGAGPGCERALKVVHKGLYLPQSLITLPSLPVEAPGLTV